MMDVIDAAIGLAADSAVGVLRRQRPDFVRYSQGSHDVLMAPADPGGVSLAERAAVALHVASIEQDSALVAHYQARLDELAEETDLAGWRRSWSTWHWWPKIQVRRRGRGWSGWRGSGCRRGISWW